MSLFQSARRALLAASIGCFSSAGHSMVVTDPGFDHFAFNHDGSVMQVDAAPCPCIPIPGASVAHMSDAAATTVLDFGLHRHIDNDFADHFGINFGAPQFVVTELRLQVHANPFRDFRLQGSNDSTTGLDGTWDNLLTDVVTERTELAWQTFAIANTTGYSKYRLEILSDYTPGTTGWAMYRWELSGASVQASEPGTLMLLLATALGASVVRRRQARGRRNPERG